MSTNTNYEEMFAKTDKTDRILVIDEKKLHILSFHSDYFNNQFKEKPLAEIPIEDVNFEEFVTLLSLIHRNPLKPTAENAERLLQLAERFHLRSAINHLGLFIMTTKIDRQTKLQIAEKYKLSMLFDQALMQYSEIDMFRDMGPVVTDFSDESKGKILDRVLSLMSHNNL